MPPTVVENAHNERLNIKTCWCIQINKLYIYDYLRVMAIYRSSRDKLTLEYERHLLGYLPVIES